MGVTFKVNTKMASSIDSARWEANLVIEVDSGQHAEQAYYNLERSAWLEFWGFKVMRFWNHDVLQDIGTVKEAIWNALQYRTLPPSQPSSSEWEGDSGVACRSKAS